MFSHSIPILFCRSLYLPLQFVLLSFLVLSLIHPPSSHDLASLNTFPLMALALLSILMALNPPMALVLLSSFLPVTQFHLPCMSNVVTTESYAILFTLRHLLSYPSSSFVLFTDSLNSLSLLQSFSSVHPLVHEIQDWLFRLSVHKSVCFCRVLESCRYCQ